MIVDQLRKCSDLHLQATTPLDPRVLDAMLPFWTGRPSFTVKWLK